MVSVTTLTSRTAVAAKVSFAAGAATRVDSLALDRATRDEAKSA
jgi:hypothetical protein